MGPQNGTDAAAFRRAFCHFSSFPARECQRGKCKRLRQMRGRMEFLRTTGLILNQLGMSGCQAVERLRVRRPGALFNECVASHLQLM
jgi:hypothetical protein